MWRSEDMWSQCSPFTIWVWELEFQAWQEVLFSIKPSCQPESVTFKGKRITLYWLQRVFTVTHICVVREKNMIFDI